MAATRLRRKRHYEPADDGFSRAAVAAHVNILIVGQIGSGKTTLLRALASGFGDDEKIAVVEQVPELNIRKPFADEYIYQPTVEGLDLAAVLDDQLYNGVDRLVVGEVHLQGITKMLEVMIVTEGSMSTYHAFSTEQAGERMKLALQLENSNVSATTALAFIRQAIELIVVLERVDGQRRVTQITELDWRSSGGRANSWAAATCSASTVNSAVAKAASRPPEVRQTRAGASGPNSTSTA